MSNPSSLLRNLPRVDDILDHPVMREVADQSPRPLAREAARQVVEDARNSILAGRQAPDLGPDSLARQAAAILRRKLTPSLRRAVNATGIVLHTGLGRAPLSSAAQHALAQVAAGYSNVQVDLTSGGRLPREVHVESLLRTITGAEAAVVVNNNAAATVLALNTLAAGREVIVSRGEMVEIGGAFRIPDIISLSGCRLVEVGCTNRTHLRDYQAAISSDTALLLSVHQSNYRIVGFASQTPLPDLVALARQHNLLCLHDLGSGALLDLRRFNLPHEPSVPESLAADADAVFFSGDKLLGGPQSGIILGRRDLLDRMHKNPFYRTFRVDKLTLAVLEATLRLFLDPESLPQQHAVTAMLTAAPDAVRQRAQALADRIERDCGVCLRVELRDGESQIGGGSLAGHPLPTTLLVINPRELPAADLAARLRLGDPPIFTRLHEDSLHLDLRTVLLGEEDLIASALEAISRQPAGEQS